MWKNKRNYVDRSNADNGGDGIVFDDDDDEEQHPQHQQNKTKRLKQYSSVSNKTTTIYFYELHYSSADNNTYARMMAMKVIFY